MNPITHLLASWSLAEFANLEARDRGIVAWVGLAPDIDGLGAVPDTLARVLGLPDPAFYGRFHHVLLHGLLGAAVLSGVGSLFGRRRLPVLLFGLLAVHLHLACDLAGSRGPAADEIWPIHYLAPFTDAGTLSWASQWTLNAWPNIVITLLLIAFVFARAATVGHSPVALFSSNANTAFVEAVQARWYQIKSWV